MSVSSSWLSRVLERPTTETGALQRTLRTAVFVLGALAVWWLSLPAVRAAPLGDLGLITALPFTFFLSLALLTIGFGWTLNERNPSPALLLVYAVALNVVLRATPALIYDEARYSWTYKHIGLSEYVRLHGGVDPFIDAYHNWPGFFTLSAFLTEAAALPNPTEFAPWAQLFFNLLYIGPLLLIYRAFTHDTRLVWGALWLFFFANWVGQDYFAPQALAFFLFLVIIALALQLLRARPKTAPHPPGARRERLARQAAVSALILVLFAAIVPSHQLTPFMAIAAITALVVFGQLSVRTLPIWMLAIAFAWIFTFARPYMEGHSDWYSNLGDLGSNLRAAVDRPAAPTVVGRSAVLLLTQAFTLLLWGLAALGALRAWRNRRWNWAPVVLAAAPFPIIVMQSYGGEIMLRIYLFSSPFMAYLAAALVYPSERLRRPAGDLALLLSISAVFTAGYLLAHYGNERFNIVSSGEVAASRHLYSELPQGSVLAFVSRNFPAKVSGFYDEYGELTLVHDYKLADKLEGFRAADLAAYLNELDRPAYVVFGKGDREYAEAFGQLPPGAAARVARELERSEHFELVFEAEGSQVFAVTGGSAR